MAGATQQARLTSERSMAARASRTIWLPLAVTWLAFLLRVGGLLSQSLWRDEVDTLRFSTQALPALLEMFRKPGETGRSSS
jgi:hypothetical protein